eukprot:3882791-Amphidinium_carterae.1
MMADTDLDGDGTISFEDSQAGARIGWAVLAPGVLQYDEERVSAILGISEVCRGQRHSVETRAHVELSLSLCIAKLRLILGLRGGEHGAL